MTEVDWWQLRHAYGRATDTPRHLQALESGDADARVAALIHLDSEVIHQGGPSTATAPAVRAVTDLLAQGRVHPDTVDSLLDFLGAAAGSVTSLAGKAYFAYLLPDLADAVATAYPVALSLLEFLPRGRILPWATNLVMIVQLPSLAGEREALAALVLDLSTRDPGPREPWIRCLALLGADLHDLLTGPDPDVRLRVALTYEDDPRSHEVILSALPEPGPFHREVVAAAIRIAPDFAAIGPEACAFVRRDNWTGFADGWGALVSFAFPAPYEPSRPLTEPQRQLVRALAGNDDKELWHPTNGSCLGIFRRAGLPHDRDACRRLASGG